MTGIENASALADRAANKAAPQRARRVTGSSDRSIVWLFIAPTMLLLLAINIFPLIWAIRLSFTGFMANLPNPAGFIGVDNYVDILTDEDVWEHFQATAHFGGLDHRAPGRRRARPGAADQPEIPQP
jgi:multiple sugar transport system permease protein